MVFDSIVSIQSAKQAIWHEFNILEARQFCQGVENILIARQRASPI